MKLNVVLGIATLCAALLIFALKKDVDRLESELVLAQEVVERQAFLAQKAAENLAARDEIDKKYAQELSDARQEIEGLRADVDAGNKRLRVKAVCPAVGVPAAASTTGLDDGNRAELDSSARSDYFSLRERLIRTEKRLEGLQEYVKNVCLGGCF